MGILKAVPVIVAIALLIGNVMVMDAAARGEARWALQAGNIIAGFDVSVQKPMASIFHQSAWTARDFETTDIGFPILADGVNLGPTKGDAEVDDLVDLDGAATSNILPEGPVNLAFPNINQHAVQSVDGVDTGFFTANWAFVADTAASNLGSEPLGIFLGSGHPLKTNQMLGSGFTWPYMIPKVRAASGGMQLDMGSLRAIPPIGTGLLNYKNATGNKTPNATATPRPANKTAAVKPANNTTGTSSTEKPLPAGWGLRKPRVDPKMNKSQIKNTSLMDRMYRNAFVGSTMHKAYEGATAFPTWIDPYDNGKAVFNACDRQKIIGLATNKSMQGAHIAPVFWDL